MGELSKLARQRQPAGSVGITKEKRRERSRLEGDRLGACHVPCFAHFSPCSPDGRAPRPVKLGLVPGGKGIRTPGGGDVSHSAIW